MAPIKKTARGRVRLVIKDVELGNIDNYVTLSELREMLFRATGHRFGQPVTLYWIKQGWLPVRKAGDGPTCAWLVRRSHARAFCTMMQARYSGEVLGLLEAAAWLGERLRGPGETLSHNTLRSWAYRGLVYPVEPTESVMRFAVAELESFVGWFETVKVRRYGRWAVPPGAQRPLWEPPTE